MSRTATTYDVTVWNITTVRGVTGDAYRVRWRVAGRRLSKTFKTDALADSFRADLVSASRRGEAFDVAYGLPVSMVKQEQPDRSWYDHACAYVDVKWRRAAPKSRAAIADALATVTVALLQTDQGRPRPPTLRRALYGWALNSELRRTTEPPKGLAAAVAWLETNTLPVSALTEPSRLRVALETLASKQDGSAAAANTFNRKRAVFYNALEYAVEQGYLDSNPLPRLNWTPPKASEAVDPRSLVNRKQANALLTAVGQRGPETAAGERPGRRLDGAHLVAFFGCMYYAAMRPAEVVELRESNIALPPSEHEWGEFHLSRSAPTAGRTWTNNGRRREARQLKHRAEEDFRIVPCPPPLVAILRTHLKRFGTSPDGRLFRGKYGGPLSESLYGRAWQSARRAAFSAAEVNSPLAARPYDLRHACVTTWLNAGVDPAQVAEWAGHSVAVLLRVYVRCIAGRDEIAKRRIELALTDDAD
jgi:integrase